MLSSTFKIEKSISFYIMDFCILTEIWPHCHLVGVTMSRSNHLKWQNGHISVPRPKKVICFSNFQNWWKLNAFTWLIFNLGTEINPFCHPRSHIVKDNYIIWQSGHFSFQRPTIKEIDALCFLQISKLKKAWCFF